MVEARLTPSPQIEPRAGATAAAWEPSGSCLCPQNQCCGAYGPDDWDLNVYFNCSGASYSREKCGVPFSCCVPDPAVSRPAPGGASRPGAGQF